MILLSGGNAVPDAMQDGCRVSLKTWSEKKKWTLDDTFQWQLLKQREDVEKNTLPGQAKMLLVLLVVLRYSQRGLRSAF